MIADVPPLSPTGEQARAWAERELAEAAYQAKRPSLLARAMDWVLERVDALLATMFGTGSDLGWAITFIALLAVIALVAVLVWRFGAPRLSTRAARKPSVLDGATDLSAQEFRDRALRAEAAQRWDEAVVQWFRAIARGLQERAVVTLNPGRTAHEVALEASAVISAARSDLFACAAMFDAVRYGHHAASAADAAALREAESRIRALPTTGPTGSPTGSPTVGATP